MLGLVSNNVLPGGVTYNIPMFGTTNQYYVTQGTRVNEAGGGTPYYPKMRDRLDAPDFRFIMRHE
jgi:hypothetical protein